MDEGREWMIIIVYKERETKKKKKLKEIEIFMKCNVK